MTAYLARRLAYAVLTFFGITIAVFVLIHIVPGDPISYFIGAHPSAAIAPDVIAAIRHQHHLDQPLVQQYFWWLRGVVTFDFGTSIVDERPVMSRILEKLPNTFELNFIAFLLAAVIGVPIGMWSAAHSGRRIERASAVFFFLLYSLPSFWVALMLMELFAVRFEVFPLFGMTSDEYSSFSAGAKIADHFQHLVLPVITLTYTQLAVYARYSKSALTEVIRQDFITTARAKGVARSAVLWRHAARNALIPLITLLGLTIPYLLSASVIVEQIFQWDGAGHLFFQSIL